MANKKTKGSTRFDFLPNKQNKYSIRKFTVGTASILVGATLVFGAYNDAQAEELDGTTTEAASTTDEEASLDEATATEAETPAVEEEATTEETAPAEETTTEEAATEAETPVEEATAEEEATTEETAPVEEATSEEATTEDAASTTPVKPANVVKAADTVETPAAATEAVAPAEKAPATTATETAPATTPETTSNTPAEVPATDIKTVQDETTASDYLAAEKNISTEEANKIASNLNASLTEVTPEALQQAIVDYLANEQNKYNVDGTLAAVREESALTNEDVVTEEPVAATMFRSATATRAAGDTVATAPRAHDSQLQKDAQSGAIYAPGTEGQKQSYSGKAWVYRDGNISNFNDKEPLANAKVYLQWVNGKGFVSPVYYTTTNPDGSYVFDLSQKLTDPAGQEHQFQLAGDSKFAVRTWVENPDPSKYNVIKHGDQKYGFHTRTSRTNESWDFTAGINRIVNGQVLIQEIPHQNDWLMKSEDQWTTAPTSDGVWPNEGIYGKVSGNVWYETGDPSGSDARAWKKDSYDVNATGVKVVASYVNDDIARQFDAWKAEHKGYTVEDFKAAQQEIVNAYQAENGQGSHIAETVVGTVESDGSYYIPFKGLYGISADRQGGKTTDEQYGKVLADEDVSHSALNQWIGGPLAKVHSHINSDYMYVTALIDDYAIWSNNYQNNMFTTADAGRDIHDAQMLAGSNGSKQNFAALAPQPMHDVIDYDSDKNFAIPGDTVESTSGGLLPSREYQIQWFKDGEPIGNPVTKTSNVDGTIGSVPITVPADLDKNATYTSAIFQPNESTTNLYDALAVDSFTAVVDDDIINEPAYEDTDATAGEEAKVTPKFTNKNGEEVATSDVPLSSEAPFILDPEATDVPEGVTVDPKTGEITFKPSADQIGKTITVPVVVTYEDGTTETVKAKFTVTSQADKYDPAVTSEEVAKGGEVDLKDNVDLTKLPEGTTVKDVTPEGTINTDQPGDYTGKVEVTYPDGSKETVDVPVTVKPSQADENDPTVTPEEVAKGGEVDLKDNVDLTKLPEGTTVKDVTPEGTINTDKPGDYTGKVEVTYPDGSKETVDVPVTVKPSQADENDPAVTPEVVEKGGEVDLKDNVDLTKLPEGTKVEDVTPEGTINTDQPGDYTGKVEVTYPDGSKETVDVPVTVKEKLTDADKNDPTVTPEEVVKGGEVDLKDNVDVTKLPEGTTVKDVTPEGTINTDQPGDYTGKVEVTYPDGSKETVDVPVSVKDTVAPEAPTVDPVKAGDTTVTGKGEPGSTITVKFPNGEEGTATVDENGNWTVDVPKGTEIKPGDELDVTATDEAGNTSDVTKVKVPDTEKDMVAPEAPTVDPVKAGDKTVTGKGEPGSTITVKFPNGEEGTAKVDKDGNWTVKVPKGTEIKPGDKLIVTATDEAGNTSEPTEVIVGGMADNGMADMDQNGKDMGDMDNNMKDMDNMDAMPGMKADMKSSKDMNNNGKEMKELPETGNESTNAPLFGSLIAALGSLFLLGRRRKENEEK
ncbi:Rib/alpha-like domain-containing protein [Staphylococcus sp. IVB6227]|uniref:Rib/alpha-like domain-containing protein n=1 Tax=Staphylococcus sp. IVB6227 TaxID=2989768 RepID=UPI0021D14539|nr:Rib/alpha-like domain-containing protein [Staphylococcus sp. IVB6227]UXR78163.1 Rib/alpha-like domain-containing protein [Staphylococcus sp. IVB6227]